MMIGRSVASRAMLASALRVRPLSRAERVGEWMRRSGRAASRSVRAVARAARALS